MTAPDSGCCAPIPAATKTTIQFVDEVMASSPFAVERVQADNGSGFGNSFHWHLFDPASTMSRSTQDSIDSEEFYPAPGRPSYRRRQPVRREAAKSGRTTTTTTAPRRSSRSNTLRTPPIESPRPAVIGLRQLHTLGSTNRMSRDMVSGVSRHRCISGVVPYPGW